MSTESRSAVETQLVTPVRRRRSGRGMDRVEAVLVTLVVLVVLAWIVVPGWFASADPLTGDPTQNFLPPSTEHLFGTDQLGRDVFARVVHGASRTGFAAGLAVLIGLVGGVTLGLVAPSGPRGLDAVLMRFVDVLTALPGILVALLIITFTGPGLVPVGIGVGLASIPAFARVTRAEVRRVRQLDYVEAAALAGAGRVRTLLRTVLPNAAGPVLALVGIDLSASIMAISSLGFLGYSALPPTPEWGLLIADGRNYLATAWWLTALPGLVIALTVISCSTLSRRLLERARL